MVFSKIKVNACILKHSINFHIFSGESFKNTLHSIFIRNGNDLLYDTNKKKSYIRECRNRKIISNLDTIQEYLLEYCIL